MRVAGAPRVAIYLLLGVSVWLMPARARANWCGLGPMLEALEAGDAKDAQDSVERRDLILRYYVRRVASPKGAAFEVLLPQEDGSLAVETAPTLRAAVDLVEHRMTVLGIEPLDWAERVDQAGDAFKEIQGKLLKVIDPSFGVTFKSRPKDLDSLVNKLFDRAHRSTPDRPFRIEQVEDLRAGRFVVNSPSALARVVEELRAEFKSNLTEVDVKAPLGPNDGGYRAVHLTIREPKSGVSIEIQVMTQRMEKWYLWDHDKVYKAPARTEEDLLYRERIRQYSRAVSDWIAAREAGRDPGTKPDPAGIKPADVFPPGYLK